MIHSRETGLSIRVGKQRHNKPWIHVLFLCLILVLATTGCSPFIKIQEPSAMQYAAEGSDISLLAIQNERGEYGYCDTSGHIVIQPKYNDARPFFDGLAAVQKGNRYGYIDTKGNVVIPFRYYQALDFHNGKAIVGTELIPYTEVLKVKCSIIDTGGTVIREIPYNYFERYSDGVIVAYDGEYSHYLDEDSNEMVSLGSGRSLNAFHDGYAMVETARNLVTFMDKSGKKLSAEFSDAKPFSQGHACVMPDKADELWGYIDTAGVLVISARYRSGEGFGEGMACVYTEDGRRAIIDSSGNEICAVDKQVLVMRTFSEGLCAVGKWNETVEAIYSDEEEQYWWGFMDASGKVVIDFNYNMVSPFRNGIAQVLVDGKIGYIDRTGKYIWEPK